jgi:hypothetical protein
MGTKNNPAHFDCYAEADPDEPMFILLARDEKAPDLIEIWAGLRRMADPSKDGDAKEREALGCADAMRRWRHAKASK